jgi:hypothetical protein
VILPVAYPVIRVSGILNPDSEEYKGEVEVTGIRRPLASRASRDTVTGERNRNPEPTTWNSPLETKE